MKQIALFISFGLFSVGVLGQPVEPVINITYSPQHPTWNDTITFYCEIEDISIPAHLHSSSVEVNGFHFEASNCYYPSMWIEIGTHYDTVRVLLPEEQGGIYTFKYQYGIYSSGGDSCVWNFPGFTGFADSVQVQVYDWNDVNSEPQLEDVTLFPNPTNEALRLRFASSAHRNITLTNMVGVIVFTSNSIDRFTTIDVSNLASGTYLCSVFEDETIHSYKFLKK